jgi:predicted ATP-grasp superfamily ATP-dependent carboligase
MSPGPAMKPAHRAFSRAPFVAVVGLSARMLAQSAARAGLNVVAMDIFGDRDTRQHAGLWFDIGSGDGLAVDRERLVDALERTARVPHMLGFIVGSGLEPLARALSEAPHLPRFIGNSAGATAAVRHPRRFFALLDELDIAHPEVSYIRPAQADGWLVKHADGCGGTHIELATLQSPWPSSAQTYFQRIGAGRPMSVLFVGARLQASVIGLAEQLTSTMGNLPFVHAGSIGPVDLSADVVAKLSAAIRAIVARTGLTGINSIDFLLDGDDFQVLEINARPSSTMALYEAVWPDVWPRGLLACHIDACLHGRLPREGPPRAALRAGQRVLFAPHAFTVSPAFSDACLADPICRDVPQPGTRIEAGQPVCTLVVTARTIDAVRDALELQHARLLQCLETCQEPCHDVITLPG